MRPGWRRTSTYLVEEVMHARRLGTGGQFILISTPSAATSTEFEDLWFTGDPRTRSATPAATRCG
jgi:hypothetical protein